MYFEESYLNLEADEVFNLLSQELENLAEQFGLTMGQLQPIFFQ